MCCRWRLRFPIYEQLFDLQQCYLQPLSDVFVDAACPILNVSVAALCETVGLAEDEISECMFVLALSRALTHETRYQNVYIWTPSCTPSMSVEELPLGVVATAAVVQWFDELQHEAVGKLLPMELAEMDAEVKLSLQYPKRLQVRVGELRLMREQMESWFAIVRDPRHTMAHLNWPVWLGRLIGVVAFLAHVGTHDNPTWQTLVTTVTRSIDKQRHTVVLAIFASMHKHQCSGAILHWLCMIRGSLSCSSTARVSTDERKATEVRLDVANVVLTSLGASSIDNHMDKRRSRRPTESSRRLMSPWDDTTDMDLDVPTVTPCDYTSSLATVMFDAYMVPQIVVWRLFFGESITAAYPLPSCSAVTLHDAPDRHQAFTWTDGTGGAVSMHQIPTTEESHLVQAGTALDIIDPLVHILVLPTHDTRATPFRVVYDMAQPWNTDIIAYGGAVTRTMTQVFEVDGERIVLFRLTNGEYILTRHNAASVSAIWHERAKLSVSWPIQSYAGVLDDTNVTDLVDVEPMSRFVAHLMEILVELAGMPMPDTPAFIDMESMLVQTALSVDATRRLEYTISTEYTMRESDHNQLVDVLAHWYDTKTTEARERILQLDDRQTPAGEIGIQASFGDHKGEARRYLRAVTDLLQQIDPFALDELGEVEQGEIASRIQTRMAELQPVVVDVPPEISTSPPTVTQDTIIQHSLTDAELREVEQRVALLLSGRDNDDDTVSNAASSSSEYDTSDTSSSSSSSDSDVGDATVEWVVRQERGRRSPSLEDGVKTGIEIVTS